MMKREAVELFIFLAIFLTIFSLVFKENSVLLQPTPDLYIDEIAPNIIYNSQVGQATAYGNGFSNQMQIIVHIGGSSTPLDPSFYEIELVSNSEAIITFPSGLPSISAQISFIDETTESNNYPFEVRSGVAPASPFIVQVTPIGLENSLDLPALPATVWGNNFDSQAKIIIDGIDMTSRVLARTDKKIDFYLMSNEVEGSDKIRVYNEGNYRSNEFNIDETTVKYSDIIHITPTSLVSGSDVTIIGHNFFPSLSNLYIDDIILPSGSYIYTENSDDTFKITFSTDIIGEGVHSIHFDVPPRNPSINYNRYNSNKVYFDIKPVLASPIILENNNMRIEFDGNGGGMSRILNKQTSYNYQIQNVYPWRLELREIVDISNPSFTINKPIRPHFNPYMGNCIRSLSHQLTQEVGPGQNIQVLKLRWNNCQIDSNNHFNYVQEYRLEEGKDYAEMNFYTENIDVIDYSIIILKNYITFLDIDPSIKETGMQSGRGLEVTKDPAYNVKSIGGRNVCSDWTNYPSPEGEPPCTATGYENIIPHGWINTDGDGYHLHANSLLDLWIGYWNENGDYIYALPVDDYTYGKGYSYIGENGFYKNTAVALYPDSFNPGNFNHVPAYAYRIGVGKGAEFTGKETWINIADKFKEIQTELGKLETPFDLRDIPEHVKNLDLTTVAGLDGEFFEVVGGQLTHKQNPNSQEIANVYEESRKYFGAEESTILIWGGEQDRVDGIKYEPIPGTTLPFLEKLNDAGWNPCFYSINGALQIRTDEPMYANMQDQGMEFDAAGNPVIVGNPGEVYDVYTFASGYSDDIGPSDASYLKWFLEKYRAFNNNGKGMKCFYSDGIFVNSWYGSGGPWNQLYQQKGWDEKALTSLKQFFEKEFDELKVIDPDTYTFHEAVSQFSTDEGLFPVQASPGAVAGENAGSGTQIENTQSIQFYQRVWGGYMDFILSQDLADPNRIGLGHIPEYLYPDLKNIPGVIQNYDKTLTESYAMPGMAGFIYKGAIPFYLEQAAFEAGGYTPLYRFSEAPAGTHFPYWTEPLQTYAGINKEIVQSRQLARNYFHGLWHPGLVYNSPEETYYYFSDFVLFIEGKDSGIADVKMPRVINTVRQAWGNSDWADRYGLMFMNTYFRSDETITFNFDFSRYRATPGQNYNLFKYSKELGREYLGTFNNNFDYTVTIPSKEFVLLELERDGDQDGDGVTGISDVCPNTQIDSAVVNVDGCSVPLTSEFSTALTSNLALSTDLLKHRDLSVGIDNLGRIEYRNQELRLLRFNVKTQSLDGIDINDAIDISANRISVNSEKYPELDQTARITFYGLSYTQTPIVTIETTSGFADCPASTCSIVSYNPATGTLVVDVIGFSIYSTRVSVNVNPTSGPSSGSGSGSGSNSGTGTPGPTIKPQCDDNIDNDNDGLVDFPADPGCLNAQDNIEVQTDTTQGETYGEENEIESQVGGNGFKIIFWIVLMSIIAGIAIISSKLARMLNTNRRFNELSKRSDDLNNAFNQSKNQNQNQQDLLSNNSDSI